MAIRVDEPKIETKVVAPRNDLKKVEVYGESKARELAGQDPGFRYQYMSTDPKNPSFYGKFLRRHEIGDAESGFAQADAWEFVPESDGVTQGRPRDDQGKPIDTALRHGDLVLMKTTAENHAVYGEIEKRKDASKAKRLASDDVRTQGASHKHRMGVGFAGTPDEFITEQFRNSGA